MPYQARKITPEIEAFSENTVNQNFTPLRRNVSERYMIFLEVRDFTIFVVLIPAIDYTFTFL